MKTITYTQARNNLAATMDRAIQDHEPIIITRQSGDAVVMMSLEDFRSWEETAYLLNSPANARKLTKSLEEARRGKVRSLQRLKYKPDSGPLTAKQLAAICKAAGAAGQGKLKSSLF